MDWELAWFLKRREEMFPGTLLHTHSNSVARFMFVFMFPGTKGVAERERGGRVNINSKINNNSNKRALIRNVA